MYSCFVGVCGILFFFFKQKTAYDMRISDWSSDVCSSDLFTGDASLSKRPMGRVIDPLSLMGARFEASPGGRLPLTMAGLCPAVPLRYVLPVASAQVKSAVLLAGLNAPGVTMVIEKTPTRDHSERMLTGFGAQVTVADAPEGRIISTRGEAEWKARKR